MAPGYPFGLPGSSRGPADRQNIVCASVERPGVSPPIFMVAPIVEIDAGCVADGLSETQRRAYAFESRHSGFGKGFAF